MQMRKLAPALALTAVIALSGCSTLITMNERVEDHFADAGEFTETTDPALHGGIVPEDATAIDLVYYTRKDGVMLAYTSPTGPAECVPGPLTGEPALESNWWPSTEPADGTVCGTWQVFANGERWYAWTDQPDS